MTKSGVARWHLVGEKLRQEMSQGLIEPGERLPTEFDLANRFGVARQTIRRALANLQSEGLVRPEHGRGNYVTKKALEYRIAARQTFEQNLLDQNMTASQRVINLHTRRCSASLANQLDLGVDDEVTTVTMIANADGVPVAISNNYVPASVATKTSRVESLVGKKNGSDYSIRSFLRDNGIEDYQRRDMKLYARPITYGEANQLDAKNSEVIIETQTLCVDGGGAPVLFTIIAYRGAMVSFALGPEVFD